MEGGGRIEVKLSFENGGRTVFACHTPRGYRIFCVLSSLCVFVYVCVCVCVCTRVRVHVVRSSLGGTLSSLGLTGEVDRERGEARGEWGRDEKGQGLEMVI